MSRARTVLTVGLVGVMALASLAACASPSTSTTPSESETAVADVAESPAAGDPAVTTGPVAPPDACALLTLPQLADAAAVGDLGAPTVSTDPDETAGFRSFEDSSGDFLNRTYCDLSFPDAARARLGIEVLSETQMDLAIGISAYNGHEYDGWSDPDAATLLSSYFAANQQVIGENPVAEWVPDSGDTMIQDGATVIATADDRYWVQVTFFLCTKDQCGAAAIGVARAVAAAVAAS